MTASGAILYLAALLAAAVAVVRLGGRGTRPLAASAGLAAVAAAYVGSAGWDSDWLTAMAAGAAFMAGFVLLASDREAPPPGPQTPVAAPAAADETGGPRGPEPTRYGDWERKGRAIDF